MIKYNHGFSKIDKIIPTTAKQYKLQEILIKHRVISFWEEALLAFVGNAQNKTKVLNFSKGVVFVACLSENVGKEIKQFSLHIIHALNQLIGNVVVFSIKLEF